MNHEPEELPAEPWERFLVLLRKKAPWAAAQLRSQGVSLYAWSPDELQKFRNAAQASWPEFATTPEAKALVESHMGYLKQLGLVQ